MKTPNLKEQGHDIKESNEQQLFCLTYSFHSRRLPSFRSMINDEYWLKQLERKTELPTSATYWIKYQRKQIHEEEFKKNLNILRRK